MQNDSLAISVINFLGNDTPNKKQIKLVESLLFHTSVLMQLHFDVRLTKREREVLQLARVGWNASVSAEILKISQKTVERHRNEAKKKLGGKTIVEAVELGIKYGFLSPKIKAKG